MGRDLLYKPQTPQYMPDEGTKTEGGKKLGVKTPAGRELGRVGQDAITKAQQAQQTTRAQQAGKAPAYKAAYFNKDISGVRDVNLGTRSMKALRGSNEASDLRKVVLPPAIGVDSPDPGELRGATDLMGLDGSFELDMQSLLGRQGAWTQGKGVTMEMIKARMEKLEEMVELRKAALGRMAEGRSNQPITSVTLVRAATTAGSAMEQAKDVEAEGTGLIKETVSQAAGMHKRIAKMLGFKVKLE